MSKKIKNAIISVSDKSELIAVVKILKKFEKKSNFVFGEKYLPLKYCH